MKSLALTLILSKNNFKNSIKYQNPNFQTTANEHTNSINLIKKLIKIEK